MAAELKDVSGINPEFNVFRFPDAYDSLREENTIQSDERSWASLANAMRVLATPDRPATRSVYRRAALDEIEAPEVDVVVEQELPSEPFVGEPEHPDDKEPEQPVDDIDPAGVQKVLDDAFHRGLEQGRQEGREALSQELREEAIQQGFVEGEQAGRARGLQQGLQQSEHEIARRIAALADLHRQMQAQCRILDHQQVHQAAVLLEKLMLEILRVELKHSPEQIEQLVSEAVQMLDTTDREVLKVRIHPSDAQWLQALVEAEQYPVRLLEDEQITPGGCRIEGSLGDVDASLEARLQDGVDHLRTLLLDDPQQMPDADLSVVTESMRQYRSVPVRQPRLKASAESVTVSSSPVLDSMANHQPNTQKAALEASANTAFTLNHGTDANSALGAWDALGQ